MLGWIKRLWRKRFPTQADKKIDCLERAFAHAFEDLKSDRNVDSEIAKFMERKSSPPPVTDTDVRLRLRNARREIKRLGQYVEDIKEKYPNVPEAEEEFTLYYKDSGIRATISGGDWCSTGEMDPISKRLEKVAEDTQDFSAENYETVKDLDKARLEMIRDDSTKKPKSRFEAIKALARLS